MIKVVNNVVEVEGISIQFDSVESANSFLLDYISKHEQDVVSIPQIEKVVKVENSILNNLISEYGCIEIENIDLSIRSYNCLKRAGINTIEDILLLDYNNVVRIRNLGRRSLLEIQECTNEFIRCDYVNWASQVPYSEYEEVRPYIITEM